MERNIFLFDVNTKSYEFFPISPLVHECDKDIEIIIIDYEGKLFITCMDEKGSYMELWVMESYNKREWHKRYIINMRAIMGRGPHTSPLVFCSTDIIAMGGYFSGIMFFNFKIRNVSMVQLGIGLLHVCFPF